MINFKKKKKHEEEMLTKDDAYIILGILIKIHRIIDTPPPPSVQKSPEALRAWDKLSAIIRETSHEGE
jgi:hypothetical protein